MSEPALRATPAVNIDEFERRLRATGSLATQQDDPLAELARLLGADDLTAPAVETPKPRAESAPGASPAPRQSIRTDSDNSRVVNVDFSGDASANAPKPPPVPTDAPDFAVETPSVEAEAVAFPHSSESLNRGEETPAPRRRVWAMAVLVLIGAVGATGAWVYRGGAVPGLGARTPPFIMAASGPTKVQPPSQETVSSPNDVASLLGKEQPVKPAAATITSSQEQPVDLNERAKAQAIAEARAATPAPSPPTIAAAPLVVVAATPAGAAPPSAPAVSNSSSSAAPSGGAPSTATPPTPVPTVVAEASPAATSPTRSIAPLTPVSAVPVAPSSVSGGSASVSAPGGSAPPAPPTPFPEPKRVKTVSVRPDGSLIGGPAQDRAEQQPIEPASEQPVNPPKPVVRPPIDADAPEPATPKLDLPPKPGKSTTRVPIAKIDTTAATATSQSPETPLPSASNSQHEGAAKKREGAAKVAAAEAPPAVVAAPQESKPAAPDSGQPRSLLNALFGGSKQQDDQPPASVPSTPSKPLKTATAEAAPAADGGGSYAVQLAAPATEAEAQTMSNKLRAKYANEFGGLEPSIHKAVVKDKTVYRVRIGANMTRPAAVSLCEKLRAAGGTCFLARD